MKQVTYARNATKALDRMPANVARRIREKISQYAVDPSSQANNVKALAGSSYLRLRVGDWRVIMDDQGNVLEIMSALAGQSMGKTMQRITTPKGETLVMLSESEYERLVDLADVAIADRVMANVAAGRDEFIPSEIVDRLLDGENKMKVWRGHRGLSARELAERTGLSASYISEIESGRKEGSISALKKIAAALGLDLDDLV